MSARPPVSICVITTERRTEAFAKLLAHLPPALERHGGACELVVANNGGTAAHGVVERAVAGSGLRTVCPCTVLDSPKNNIATGRNVALGGAAHERVAFIDDDEYPSPAWLAALADVMTERPCTVVAGPILPVYAESTRRWVRTVDVHNVRGLATFDEVEFAASGNFLIDRRRAPPLVFDEAYGKSGGSDTEFFLRLRDTGATILWAADAVVHEDIPADRSTVRYTLHRCLTQGGNYRRIMRARGRIDSEFRFGARALATFALSLPVGLALIAIGHGASGTWMKRAFSNLGKIWGRDRLLYG